MEPSGEEPQAKRPRAEPDDEAKVTEDAPAAEDAPAEVVGAVVEETPADAEEAPAEEKAAADTVAPAEKPAAEEAVAPAIGAPADSGAAEGGGISNDELVELLKQRAEAKRMRDFATSDTIRSTLEARGVHITDAKNTSQVGRWVATDGREGNTQGPDFFQPVPQPDGRRAADAPLGYIPPPPAAGSYVGIYAAPGGYGAPYTAPPPPPPQPVAGAISNEELAEQLRERAQAKVTKDYARSDEIRAKLEARGIKIHDASKSWSASDGRVGNTSGPDFFTPSSAGGGYGGYGGGYGAPPPQGGGAHEVLSQGWILAKMAEREKVRAARDFARSDVMRDELRSHGIHVDDRTKIWTAQDGRSGTVSGGPPPSAPPAYGGQGGYGAPPGGGYGAPYGGYYGGHQAPPGQHPPPPPHYGGHPPPPPPYGGYGAYGGYGGYGQGGYQ